MTVYTGNDFMNKVVDIPDDVMRYIPLIKAHVKVWIIEEVKKYIDNGEIKQDKLLDESNCNFLVQTLYMLICRAWDELKIDISDALLVVNYQISIDLYAYLYNDFKLLSINYRVNKIGIYFNPQFKKKVMINTIEVLKEKAKYLEGNGELKDKYIKVLIDLEYKVDYHGNNNQLTALLIAMENAKIYKILDVGEKIQKLIYPEILDLFKDYFYLLFAFESDKERMKKLKINLKNNPKTKLTPDEHCLLFQLGFVQRGQEVSYIRNSYEKKYMFEFHELKVLLRQMLKDKVKSAKRFASYAKFDDMRYMPLPLFKYTLLYG